MVSLGTLPRAPCRRRLRRRALFVGITAALGGDGDFLESLVHPLDFLASVAALVCLILDHRLCPDMRHLPGSWERLGASGRRFGGITRLVATQGGRGLSWRRGEAPRATTRSTQHSSPLLVAAPAAAGCLGPPLPLPAAESAGSDGRRRAARAAARRPARAFAITRAGDLLDGIAAEGRLGDYRLDNEAVAVIVSAPDHAFGFADSGGNIIDAAPPAGATRSARSTATSATAFRASRSTTASRSPSATAPRWCVARGHDSDEPTLAIETEYALAPGARALRLTSTFTNGGDKPLSKLAIGDAVDWGRTERFVPEARLSPPTATTLSTPAGSAGFGADAAYAYAVAEGPLDCAQRLGLDATSTRRWSTCRPAQSVSVTRWLVVGLPTDTALYEALADAAQGALVAAVGAHPRGGERRRAGRRARLLRRPRRAGGGDALDGAGLRGAAAAGRLSGARRGHRAQRARAARGHRRRERRAPPSTSSCRGRGDAAPSASRRTARRCRRS